MPEAQIFTARRLKHAHHSLQRSRSSSEASSSGLRCPLQGWSIARRTDLAAFERSISNSSLFDTLYRVADEISEYLAQYSGLGGQILVIVLTELGIFPDR